VPELECFLTLCKWMDLSPRLFMLEVQEKVVGDQAAESSLRRRCMWAARFSALG
jgi:hypothetical protein